MPQNKILPNDLKEIGNNNSISISLIILSALSIVAALYFMRPVLVPLTFSLFLFMVMTPIISCLKSKLKFPKWLAIFFTYILLFSFCMIFLTILSRSVTTLVQDSKVYQQQLINVVDEVSVWFYSHGIELDLSLLNQSLKELPIWQWVRQISGNIIGSIGKFILVLVFTLFFLFGKSTRESGGILHPKVKSRITRFLSVKFFTSATTAILVGLTLYFFEVQLALMFGVLTFLLNFIPSVGSVIATLLPLPIIFLQFGTSLPAILALVIPGLIQFVIGNIVDPKLMGENLGLHPAMVLLSLLFWGFIWGIPGMFLAVPMTAILKVLFELFEGTKPLAEILEGRFK
jgi:AI-2 transport protein TqsA